MLSAAALAMLASMMVTGACMVDCIHADDLAACVGLFLAYPAWRAWWRTRYPVDA